MGLLMVMGPSLGKQEDPFLAVKTHSNYSMTYAEMDPSLWGQWLSTVSFGSQNNSM